jgi:hypothetical protein
MSDSLNLILSATSCPCESPRPSTSTIKPRNMSVTGYFLPPLKKPPYVLTLVRSVIQYLIIGARFDRGW